MHKKIIVLLLLLGSCLSPALAQKDTALYNRLNKVILATEQLDWDLILDYTYPLLFELVDREQMKAAMQHSFDGEDVSMKIDSVRIDTIFPMFTVGKGKYVKVIHTMRLRMIPKVKPDSTAEEEEELDPETMTEFLETEFGEGNVKYDTASKTFILYTRSQLVAILDELSPRWTFVNFQEKSPMAGLLFSKEVLDRLATYK